MDYAIGGRRLHRRIDSGRRPPGRPRADRDDAARPDHHLRRHGRAPPRRSTATSIPTCRASSWSTRSRTRRRSRCGWRTRSASGSGGAPRHAVRARSSDRGPRQGGSRAARPGRPRAGEDRRLRRPRPRAHRLLQGGGGARSTRSRWVGASRDAIPIDFTGDLKEIDGRAVAKRGRIPGRTENPRLQRVDLGAYRAASGDRCGADERDSAYELFQRGVRLLEEGHPGAAAVLLERAAASRRGRPRSSRRWPRVLQPGPAGPRRGTIPSHRGARPAG